MRPLGFPIAVGKTADILSWGDGRILKLYRYGAAPELARREAQQARFAHASGLPTPAVIDVVAIEGRTGVIFERRDGPAMLDVLRRRPGDADELARRFAVLHAAVHERQAPEFPEQRERLRTRITRAAALAADRRAAALVALGALPDGQALCHGDFHPGNILMTAGGPVIIDWLDATRGDPLGDLARTALLLRHAALTPHQASAEKEAFSELRASFLGVYLEKYAELRPFEETRLGAWRGPVAAARLEEPLSAAERKVLALEFENLLHRP